MNLLCGLLNIECEGTVVLIVTHFGFVQGINIPHDRTYSPF